ncbi:MAG TPA: hypothetical protein VHM69_03400 [Rubrobacter sp.]|nr:hypothetical protein [Rubrobacter sp.]
MRTRVDRTATLVRPENATPGRRPGRRWSIAGIICGFVAVVLLPIVLGPLGVILGIVGLVKGDRALGVVAIVVGIVGLVLGFVFSAFVISLTNQT